MKKLILTIIIMFLFVLPFQNWTGLTIQEQKKKAVRDKITYLYRNYPPSETGWMHEISINVKSKN